MVDVMKFNSRKNLKNKNLKSFKFLFTAVVGLSLFSTVYASDFYTIIGPDGRPIVIERNKSEVESKTKQKTSLPPSNSARTSTMSESNREVSKQVNTPVVNNRVAIETQSNKPVNSIQNSEEANKKKYEQNNQQDLKKSNQQEFISKPNSEKVSKEHAQVKSSSNVESNKKLINNSTQPEDIKSVNNELLNQTTIIDGVEYIDSEYLEDNEFNVEGRKRFYIISDPTAGGAVRFEALERRKGITKSVLSTFLQASEPVEQKVIALSPQYMRIEQNEVVQSLGQQCFTGKKIKDAKLLVKDQSELALWPTAPIKESFTFNVVELDQKVKQLHFQSYASSTKNPTYYWPLVVFLDDQGCVIEGATGFKIQNNKSDVVRYSSLEGVIVKPDQAKFILLTPLAESIDVQGLKLTESGQIRLKAIL